MEQRWVVIAKKADFKGIAERFGIDQVTARIINNRGITGDEEIEAYLRGGLDRLCDAHLLKDGELAAGLLEDGLRAGASIRIIGDYDIDGVMSSYLLKRSLDDIKDRFNFNGNITVRIPHRVHDGYGLSQRLIEQAEEDGVELLLTCDNGISALEEIALAKSCGMTVIVTDHHEVPYVETEGGGRRYLQSEADAVVNPHQADCAYPYKGLCGAGVAWKLMLLLYERMGLPREECHRLLEYVAFATVGDIMPLTGENRILVREGLARLRRTKNPGLLQLIEKCGLRPEQITAYHIGFVLGPCINASGRLDSAERAMELLLAEDERAAAKAAERLVHLNEERKSYTEQGVEAAIRQCEVNGYEDDPVLVIYLPEVHESVAGIIAGRIRERYYKPVFILTDGQDCVKGSGRSVEEYSMFEQMSRCKELFIKYGGHPAAAGLSIAGKDVEVFRARINELCPAQCRGLVEKLRIDVPMPIGYLTMGLVQELDALAPFGKDNPRPLFADRGLEVVYLKKIGNVKKGFKLFLRDANGATVEAICFRDADGLERHLKERFGEREVEKAVWGMKNDLRLTVAYYPQINEYRGIRRLQISIENYK